MERLCSNPDCGNSLAMFSQTFQHPVDRTRFCSLACLKQGARGSQHSRLVRQDATLASDASSSHQTGRQRTRRPSAVQRMRERFFRHQQQQRIENEIKRLRGKRPYFFWWNLFVLTAVLIVSLTLYPIAPIGFSDNLEYSQVTSASGNPLVVQRNVSRNIFIGPKSADLVRLGAMFSPCLRADKKIKETYYDPLPRQEATFGCCLRQAGALCYPTAKTGCLGLQDYSNETCFGAICCVNPADFPTCQRIPPANLPSTPDYDICRCSLVARPCCRGLYGDCVLATQEQCSFYGGHFATDQMTCSKVDCLRHTCGLGPFVTAFKPDQWYRLILANFVCSGVCHYLLAIVAFTSIGLDLERTTGWWRYGLIYMVSGVGGYSVSGLFTPYQVSCGPFPSIFGLLGTLFVELFNAWQKAYNPWRQFFKLFVALVLALAVGLLPYINNFSHVGGFVFGLISAFILLPWQSFGSVDRARKRIFAVVAFLGLIVLSTVVLSLLFTIQDFTCELCGVMDCVNFVDGFCSGTGNGPPF